MKDPSDPVISGILSASDERWPIAGTGFTISRGVKREAHVVVAEITAGGQTGRGECVPYGRYGETIAHTLAEIAAFAPVLKAGITREKLRQSLAPGAARNAIDCALWDVAARLSGTPVWRAAAVPAPDPLVTAFTISLASPRDMAAAATAAADHPLLKLKLGAPGDQDRLQAVRAARRDAQLIVDANEGWRVDNIEALLELCARAKVMLVEQPLPADNDALLSQIRHPVPICADEAAHGLDTLPGLAGRYDVVNIKLDKTGGLTEALAMADAAGAAGLRIMVGCMVATSLSMAPAMLLGGGAMVVDLDGPLLLAADRPHGLRYEGAIVHPPTRRLWGG